MDQKRNAERLPLPTPFDAVAGDRAVRIVEISLIGCRIEHVGRLPIGGATVLEFQWNDQDIRVPAAISRSKMLGFAPGGERYESGLRFAVSVETAPEQLKQILDAFVEKSPVAPPLHEKVPFLRWYDDVDEPEPELEPEPEYVECSLLNETTWERRRVCDPRQPREGFTTIPPENDEELELLCRTYQYADPETRKLIRLTLELQIVERMKR